MRKISIFVGTVLFFGMGCCFAQETLTITTYYPSPYGVYNSLLTNRLGIGDNNGDGFLTSADVPPNPGDVWIRGNVSIGTTSPTARLDVNGSIRVRVAGPDTITGTLPDIAEYIAVSDANKLELGDVIVIDRKNPQHFTLSSKPYDSLVAGIISSRVQAALVIGNDGENREPLALAGQVKCKVTTENGTIEIGDLLTTSSKPGHAMKADPNKLKPGMILGKALESLKKGEGKIVVLVTLQ